MPPVVGLRPGTQLPLPMSVSESTTRSTLPPPQHPSTLSAVQFSTVCDKKEGQPPTIGGVSAADVVSSLRVSQTPSNKVPLPSQAIPTAASSGHVAAALPITVSGASAPGPPVPPDSAKPLRSPAPSNPFRDSAATHTRSMSLQQPATESLHGFDPAPNPFKQSKPKIVKPTPIVATSETPNPISTAAEPGRVVTAAHSMRSIDDVLSPPLPPRPTMGAEKPPPPLPPRAHISPLIQAGLEASLQVRKQKHSLPPKTFTVLQSSSSRSKASEPRLLTGESAPVPPAEEPQHSHAHNSKRRVSGQESRRSATETVVGGTSSMKRNNSDESGEPQRAASGSATILAAPKPSRPGASRRSHHHREKLAPSGSHNSLQSGSNAPGRVAAPKAQYPNGSESLRTKPTLPLWLREQEELQRSAMLEGRAISPPPADAIPEDGEESRRLALSLDLERSKEEPTMLDDDYDVYPTELSEQASRAASIDRPNNPFVHRSSQAEAEKLKVQPLPRHHRNFSQQSAELGGTRGLARSKTQQAKDATPGTSLPASRKRLESFPATLDSGTYAGFRHPASGGLRLVPPSAKADVGISDIKRPSARRHNSSALSVGSSSGAAPMSLRDDEDSGETSLNSTNPISVQGLTSQIERGVSNRIDGGPASDFGPQGQPQSLKGRVSELLKLQNAPPKGQRPLDDFKRDALRLVDRKSWIRRMGTESEGLLYVDEEDGPKPDENEGDDQWDDSPTPDDGYGNESSSTTTTTARDSSAAAASHSVRTTSSHNTLGKGPPPAPPKRAATMSAGPIARRLNGFVARRASKFEKKNMAQRSTSCLERAASFSARESTSQTSTEGGQQSKRSSWLESFEEEVRRRRGDSKFHSTAVMDDDGSDDDGDDRDTHSRGQPSNDDARWKALA